MGKAYCCGVASNSPLTDTAQEEKRPMTVRDQHRDEKKHHPSEHKPPLLKGKQGDEKGGKTVSIRAEITSSVLKTTARDIGLHPPVG